MEKRATRVGSHRGIRLMILLAAAMLAGCGGSDLSGAYVPQGEGVIWDKFDFQSGNKVAVTAMGQLLVGDYAVMDDGRIRVMANSSVVTLKKMDDGCLEITAGDANEAAQAARMGMDPSQFGHFCKQ